MTVMNSNEFVNKMKDIANNYKTLYVLGCFGAPMNATNKKRYTNNNSYNKKRAGMINAATADTFGFDCVCVIKRGVVELARRQKQNLWRSNILF